ncbi:glycoside hydrolase family 32 protein [Sphingomonas sp. T9W2]|uniref:glycoside hydrolase family 32 protein n=1 Tax=Sphingomonas sp. T9W2 TaxID=3143183 RepID=UPI0031F5A957
MNSIVSRRQTLGLIATLPLLPGCGASGDGGGGRVSVAGPAPTPTPGPTPTPTATSVSGRPRYHIAAPDGGWINDPQRPVRIGDGWTMWALYNPTWPNGGTEWRRWTSTDLVTWTDRGVSIPRRTTSFGDVWSGSAVIDTANTAGFGAGTLIALATMPADNAAGQNQSTALWYSRDNGASFAFHAIVHPNFPGNKPFRDPTVFWHAPTARWVMTLSEEGKIGFYTSPDLKQWSYASGFLSTLVGGVMECSHLFPLHLYEADGTTTADKWVLLVGGDGTGSGFTGGTYYWVGSFDGTGFIADSSAGQWLDGGADYYAAVVWQDATAADPLAGAWTIGWMNNWAYANQPAAPAGYRGQLTIVRNLRLQRAAGSSPRLRMTPIAAQNGVFQTTVVGTDQTITDGSDYVWPAGAEVVAGRIDLTLSRVGADWPGGAWLSVRGGDGYFTQIGFELRDNRLFVKRDTSGPDAPDHAAWRQNRSIPCDAADGRVAVSIFLDTASIEVFVNDGDGVLSERITAPSNAARLNLNASGGSLRVSEVRISKAS